MKLAALCGEKGIRIGPFGSQLHARDYVESGIPLVMPTNLRSDEIVTDDIKSISSQKAAELSVHRLEPGDVLLPRRGDLKSWGFVALAKTVGFVALARSEFGCQNQAAEDFFSMHLADLR